MSHILILVLWPVSCVLAFLLGALAYHGVRMLAARPIYKATSALDAGVDERKLKKLADKQAADLAQAYLKGLQLTRDEYNGGVQVDPRGVVTK